MLGPIDFAAAVLVIGVFATAGAAFALSAWISGCARHFERLERERGLPLFGRTPLEAVYAVALPVGRALAAVGISANGVTAASAVLAAGAGLLFATGHFGLGAAVAVLAALADALDGIIARETGTAGPFGQILDTTVDRYVEAMFIGGIAFLVRADAALFVVSLAALVGSFMVSYASSVLRELRVPDVNAPMRRAHRLVFLLGGAVLVPLVQAALPGASQRVQLAPVVLALAAIAVVGNVSAVKRLLSGARSRSGAAARTERGALGIEPVVTPERVTHP